MSDPLAAESDTALGNLMARNQDFPMENSPSIFYRIFTGNLAGTADKINILNLHGECSMGMNTKILQESFEEIKPVAGKVVDHFYDVLFSEHPEAKALFKPDRMGSQKAALIQSLVTIFANLEDKKELESYLVSLGSRHERYGAKPEHYDWVAESLLKTLKFFFGDTWTSELEDSWVQALGLIVETMRSALPVGRTEEVSMKEEIEKALKELMRESVLDLASHADLRALVDIQAQNLIRNSLDQQLQELRNKFNKKRAA